MGTSNFRFALHAFTALFIAGAPSQAGTISLAWTPVEGADGYRVYYGATSGSYAAQVDVGDATETTIVGLEDCTTWYLAVKAYNDAGESSAFSNELIGWPRPKVDPPEPRGEMQGVFLTLDVQGANFRPGATVEVDNPNVLLESAAVVGCDRIQVAASVEPSAEGFRAAEIGWFTITVTNPDTTYGQRTQAFEVRINPARFDVNRTDETTEGRLDGKDTVWLARQFGNQEQDHMYDPDFDFDGDGWVDGQDLAYVASNLGSCWSGTEWTMQACPESLR